MLMVQAAAILNMMEGFLGTDTFRNGVRVRIISYLLIKLKPLYNYTVCRL